MTSDNMHTITRRGLLAGSLATLSTHVLPAASESAQTAEATATNAIRVFRANVPQAELQDFRPLRSSVRQA